MLTWLPPRQYGQYKPTNQQEKAPDGSNLAMVMHKNHRMQMRRSNLGRAGGRRLQPATGAGHTAGRARVQDGGSGQTRVAAGLRLLLDGTACSGRRRFDGVGVLRRGGETLLPRQESRAREERRSGCWWRGDGGSAL
jgi:hypothetical protein